MPPISPPHTPRNEFTRATPAQHRSALQSVAEPHVRVAMQVVGDRVTLTAAVTPFMARMQRQLAGALLAGERVRSLLDERDADPLSEIRALYHRRARTLNDNLTEAMDAGEQLEFRDLEEQMDQTTGMLAFLRPFVDAWHPNVFGNHGEVVRGMLDTRRRELADLRENPTLPNFVRWALRNHEQPQIARAQRTVTEFQYCLVQTPGLDLSSVMPAVPIPPLAAPSRLPAIRTTLDEHIFTLPRHRQDAALEHAVAEANRTREIHDLVHQALHGLPPQSATSILELLRVRFPLDGH